MTDKKLLSIVVPAYNEEQVLVDFHKRLSAVLDSLQYDSEIIYVNDGSTDHTLQKMKNLREGDQRVAIVDLSRNFGKEIALTAGLDHAGGNAAISLDADLQHPPELIPELISSWEEGFDVVYAVRTSRHNENFAKRLFTGLFYRIIGLLGNAGISENSSDYRLLSSRALNSIVQLRERHRIMKGLFSWIGFSQKAIPYQPDLRRAGKTKWNYFSLWNLALEAITSFSILPLKIATYVGLITALIAFLYGGIVIFKKLIFGDPVPGYPSLMVVVLFLGGIQLMSIGIIGEYLGRVFDETKRRPLYFLKSYEPPEAREGSKSR